MLNKATVIWIVSAAAAEPAAAGLFLMLAPSRLGWLILGAELFEPGQAVGRLAGIGLLAFALACLPASGAATPLTSATRALSIYHLLEMAFLGYLGVAGKLVGVLLWPAVVLHGLLFTLLAGVWLVNRTR